MGFVIVLCSNATEYKAVQGASCFLVILPEGQLRCVGDW